MIACTTNIMYQTVLLELGEGEMPVFIDVNTISIPATRKHAIRTISNINIISHIGLMERHKGN